MSTLPAEVVHGAEEIFEHLNGNHADSVVFLASHLAGTTLIDAEIVGLDASGVVIDGRDAGGRRALRLDFDGPVTSTADVQGQLLTGLSTARAEQPDGPLTSIEAEMAQRGQIPTRTVTVASVDDVAPGLREITFRGLRGHRALGPDDFFLVIRPDDERRLDDGTTMADYLAMAEGDRPDWAYYTCRRWRPERGELDAWFVLHDHDGPISGWARTAQPGDRVQLWGPRTAYEPPEETTSVLLVGDETGLGAFAGIVESTPADTPVTVLVESDDGRPVIELPTREGIDVRWIDRAGVERGSGTQLVDAVTSLDLVAGGLYAYGAGESKLVTAVRKHLRDEREVPGPQVQMVGYWRRRT